MPSGRRGCLALGAAVPVAGLVALCALLLLSAACDFVLHHTGDRGADLLPLTDESSIWRGTRGTLKRVRVFTAGPAASESDRAPLSAIPRRVITTAPTWWIAPGLKRAVASFVSRNGAFVSQRFDDADQRAMVAEEVDSRTLEAFDALVPTAFKADIWRLVALKRGGGVYHDAKMLCVSRELEGVIAGVSLVLAADRTTWANEPRCGPALYQAFLAAAPRHPFVAFALRRIVMRVLNLPRSPSDIGHLKRCCLSLTGPHALEHAAAAYYRNWSSVSHEYSGDYALARRDGSGVDRIRMLVRVDEHFQRTYRWDETAAYVAKRERRFGADAPAVPLMRTEYAGYAEEKRALRYEHTALHYSEACAGSSPVLRDESGAHWIASPNRVEKLLRALLRLLGVGAVDGER